MNKIFITSGEAASMLGISISTLYKMTSANRIPYYRPSGKLVYFKVDELNDWITKSRIATGAELQAKAERYCRR